MFRSTDPNRHVDIYERITKTVHGAVKILGQLVHRYLLPSSKLLSIIIIIPDSNQLFTQATYILQQKCG